MDESILNSVKKMLGITSDNTAFDEDLITHINTVFIILKQLGAISEDFSIIDSQAVWGDVISSDLAHVKTYMYAKVRSMFDNMSGTVVDQVNEIAAEMEFRILVACPESE